MPGNRKYLNRDEIKLLAVLAMVLNHISTIFPAPGHLLSEIMLDVGYLTAPVMCYFLTEGYRYTRSRRKYALRLAVFAAISEIPYCLAFTKEGILEYTGMNMIFTLFLCFLLLEARERIASPFWRTGAQVLLIAVSAVSDWGVLAPVMTLLFARARKTGETAKAFLGAVILIAVNDMAGSGGLSDGRSLLYTLGGAMGAAFAAVLILCCYNGRRAEKGGKLWGWFFYFFYPGHLLLLGILRVFFAAAP